jgi:hypothetical protein
VRRVPAWYVALLAIVGVERLRELGISRSNETATHGVRAAPRSYPLMVATHVGLLTLLRCAESRCTGRWRRFGGRPSRPGGADATWGVVATTTTQRVVSGAAMCSGGSAVLGVILG